MTSRSVRLDPPTDSQLSGSDTPTGAHKNCTRFGAVVRAASLLTIRLAPLAAPAILAALLASASALAATQPVSPDGAWT
jgi:hypothetical protein